MASDVAARPGRRVPGILRAALLVARKDLLIEFRTRSAFLAAAVFALLAVVIFRFSWDRTAVAAIDLEIGRASCRERVL